MDDFQNAEIWRRINNLIKVQNLTQSSVSTLCGFSPRRIQNLSGGNRLPDAIEICKIAKALNTSVEYLITGKENETKKEVLDLAADINSLPPTFQNAVRVIIDQLKALSNPVR